MKKERVIEILNSFGEEFEVERLIEKLLSSEEVLNDVKDKMVTYDPEFTAMMDEGDADIKAGKGISMDIDNLWK